MPIESIALFFHLLGALLFASGIVLAGVGFETARRRKLPSEITLLLSLTRIGVLLVASGALLTLVFGLWLVHIDGYSYGAEWIDDSFVLYVLAIALGGVGGRAPKRARRLATRLAQEREEPGEREMGELKDLLNDPTSLAANWLSALAVLGIVALMVFKP